MAEVDLGKVKGDNAIISKTIHDNDGYMMLNEGLSIAWGNVFYQDLKPNEWVDKEIVYPRQFKECLTCLISTNAHSMGVNRVEVNKISDDKFNPHHVQVSVKSPTTWGGVSWVAIGTF